MGARIAGSIARSLAKGQTIEIRARSGKSWQATIAKVIWRGDGVALDAEILFGQMQLIHVSTTSIPIFLRMAFLSL